MRYILLLFLSLFLGCGESGRDSFAGTWNGTLPLVANGCASAPPSNQDFIFPIVVNDSAENSVEIVAATGKSGTGATLEYSFLTTSQLGETFPTVGSLVGCEVSYHFGLFAAYDSNAQSELQVRYEKCPDSSANCTILYAGDANRIG